MNEIKKSNLLKQLEATLIEISPDRKLALAFSTGVDSTILLNVIVKLGFDVLAVTFNTNLTRKMISISNATDYANSLGVKHAVLDVDVMSNPNVSGNSKLRCYYCKSCMFEMLSKYANERGYSVLIDGTNADDLKEYRPGLKAKDEYGVLSPIAMSGLTKMDIRQIGKELNLPIASKPSSPCLLTRFPYDTQVSNEMLEVVEAGEQIIKKASFDNCRLRVHGNIARIEIPKDDFKSFVDMSDEIINDIIKLGFDYCTLDLSGLRSGSMDV